MVYGLYIAVAVKNDIDMQLATGRAKLCGSSIYNGSGSEYGFIEGVC
jgi:hypothetical protein